MRSPPATKPRPGPVQHGEPLEVGIDEKPDKLREADRGLPAEPLPRLRWVADKIVQLGLPALERAVEVHVLIGIEADVLERDGNQLANAVGLACRDHVVTRLVLLEHQPHRAHVVAGEAPVAPGVEIAEPELPLEAQLDPGGGIRDLACDEVERPPRRLVVVEDPGGRMHAVPRPVAAGDEVPVCLRDAIRGQGGKGRLSRSAAPRPDSRRSRSTRPGKSKCLDLPRGSPREVPSPRPQQAAPSAPAAPTTSARTRRTQGCRPRAAGTYAEPPRARADRLRPPE